MTDEHPHDELVPLYFGDVIPQSDEQHSVMRTYEAKFRGYWLATWGSSVGTRVVIDYQRQAHARGIDLSSFVV